MKDIVHVQINRAEILVPHCYGLQLSDIYGVQT